MGTPLNTITLAKKRSTLELPYKVKIAITIPLI